MATADTDHIAAYREAWDKETGGGRDPVKARAAADAYVAANPTEFDGWEEKTEHELCRRIGVFREAGMDDEVLRIEIWCLHRFDPQQIGGEQHATVRISNG